MVKKKITKAKKPQSMKFMTPRERSNINKNNRLVLVRGRFLPLLRRGRKSVAKRLVYAGILIPARSIGLAKTFGRVRDQTIGPSNAASLAISSEKSFRLKYTDYVNVTNIHDSRTLTPYLRPSKVYSLYEPDKEVMIMHVIERGKYALKRKRLALTR